MIDMPPRRSLPPQIRDKMLVDLREKMDEQPRRSKTPYAVAAGVAALVAGGVVAVTALQGGGDGTDTASGKLTGDTKGVEAAAQRCMAASKKVGGFPAGAQWKVAAHSALAGYSQLAIKVADKPVFCEVTATSVTLSKYDTEPNYVPGSKTGSFFRGEGGVVGLVVDPSWGGIDAYEDTGDGRYLLVSGRQQPGTIGWRYADGIALWWPAGPMAVAPKGGKVKSPLPAAPKSTVSVTDRPYTGPAPDYTSAEGAVLHHCIENGPSHQEPLADPGTWQAGPMITSETGALVLVIRGIDHVTTCNDHKNDTSGLTIGWWGGNQRQVRLPAGNQPVLAPAADALSGAGETRKILYGSVPLDAASMTLAVEGKGTLTAHVRNGSFLADAGKHKPFTDDEPVVTSVTVKDAHGKVLYHGKPAK